MLTLRSRDTAQQETLTGRVRITDKPIGGRASRLTLTPDFTLADGQAQGSLRIQQDAGGKTVLDAAVRLTAMTGTMPKASEPERSFDLLDPTGQQQPAARQAFQQMMLSALRGLLMELPEPQRLLLIHLMGRDLRTQDSPNQTDGYPVTHILSTEEGTP